MPDTLDDSLCTGERLGDVPAAHTHHLVAGVFSETAQKVELTLHLLFSPFLKVAVERGGGSRMIPIVSTVIRAVTVGDSCSNGGLIGGEVGERRRAILSLGFDLVPGPFNEFLGPKKIRVVVIQGFRCYPPLKRFSASTVSDNRD